MANIPALPRFTGFDTRMVTIITEKNTIPFASNIARRNVQFTVVKSSLARDRKMRDGRAKVPTNVPIPLDSVCDTTLRRPAMYLKIIKKINCKTTYFQNICYLKYGFDLTQHNKGFKYKL